MSMKPFRWAKKQTGLTSSEKFVLVMLADYYNDEWQRAWPSPATLSVDTGLSPSSVKRALKSLQTKGFVVAEQWMLNDGAVWMANRYLLPLYDPTARAAYEQPVLAFVGSERSVSMDLLTAVPGSNLFIEHWSLSPDPA